jgi:hypothetical protein
VNLLGTGQFTCLDLGVCIANNRGTSSIYISYESTNSGHWTADLAIAFYGTGQTFGGCQSRGANCHCGDTLIGSFPSDYNQFVNGNVQVNSSFNPTLASGFAADIAMITTDSMGQSSLVISVAQLLLSSRVILLPHHRVIFLQVFRHHNHRLSLLNSLF